MTATRISFARWCRQARADLDVTQRELAAAVGVSRTYVAAIEGGRANPSLALVDRIGAALGIEFELIGASPIVPFGEAKRPRDGMHARCSGYVQRRLAGHGWLVAREVEVREGRFHGWIDLLAFDPRTGVLLVIEVKTSLDDIGRLERQLGWYERLARTTEPARGWRPRELASWVLVLATTEVDVAMSMHRDVLRRAFPCRASEMRAVLAGGRPTVLQPAVVGPAVSGMGLSLQGRAIALVDPRSRRRDWLIPSRSDGRRWPAPYLDLAAAKRILDGSGIA
jgi:transcriptional regulator with XRE-family HTH domain